MMAHRDRNTATADLFAWADEYDAAQKRGEVVGAHDGARKRVPEENAITPATTAELGVTRKDIHEARQIRDAEQPVPAAASANARWNADANNAPAFTSEIASPSEIGCTEAIDFMTRRTKLGRWILHPGRSIEAYERQILREVGELAPAPILAFAPRPPPADPGDDDAPLVRTG